MSGKLTAPPSGLNSMWNYQATPGFYDEVLGSGKQLRPQWGELSESLTAIGNQGLARRWREGQRLIHDNGITYNVYSDPESTSRPWPLDPVPVLLSADAYTKVSETTEHGYPIREHIRRLIDGDIIWAPAIDGAFVLTTRGGDFDLQLGTDVSIGYLSHDADTVQLYLQETLTFLCYTAEASVALSP